MYVRMHTTLIYIYIYIYIKTDKNMLVDTELLGWSNFAESFSDILEIA